MITHMTENSGGDAGRLVRRRDGRLVAGVCTGLAAYLRIDVNLVRLAFGVFTIFYGLGALIYLAAWVLLPAEDEKASPLQSFVRRF